MRIGTFSGENPLRRASTPRVLARVVTLPVRLAITLAWRGYGLLWWAFDDDSSIDKLRRAASPQGDAPPGAPPAGLPLRPRPVMALRVGLAATGALSAASGLFSIVLVSGNAIPAASGLLLWTLATLAFAIVTILLVRRRERLRAVERARKAATPIGRAQARVGQTLRRCASGVSACSAWLSTRGRAWSGTAKKAAATGVAAENVPSAGAPRAGSATIAAAGSAFSRANARAFAARAASATRRGTRVASDSLRVHAASSRRVLGSVLGPVLTPMWSSLRQRVRGEARVQQAAGAPTQ